MSYMDKLNPKLDYIDGFSDIVRLLEKVIYKNIHVASVAIFKEITKEFDVNAGYGIATVEPIPTETKRGNYSINGYFLDNTYTFNNDELVVIVYTDLNFVDNLNNNKIKQKESTSTDSLHSQMNAVIIPVRALSAATANNPTITIAKNDGNSIGTFTLNQANNKIIKLPDYLLRSELPVIPTTDKHEGTIEFDAANFSQIYNLITAHTDIIFSATVSGVKYNLLYEAKYISNTYTINMYYISEGTLTALTEGTIYYSYITE